DDGGLANTGTAGHDQNLGYEREPDRAYLAFCKDNPDALLDPRQRLVGVDPGPGERAIHKPGQPLGDRAFRAMQARQKHARRLAHPIGNDGAFRQSEVECGADQFSRDLEQLLGQRHQLIGWQSAVAFVHGLGQCIGDAGANPDHCGLFNAEPHGDRIGGLESDAANVTGQPIRIFSHDLHGVSTICLEIRTAPAVPTPWLCRKIMISRTAFCSAQAARMLAARTGPMPSTSRSRSGVVSMMSNTFSPNARTSFFAYTGPTPRIMPDERYFSMPSTEVGGD